MKRREDWPERLAACVAAARARPFEWGAHDCCLFAADCIQAMTDVDVAADFRGKYATAKGAAKAMKKFAGGGVLAVAEKIAAAHGLAHIAPAAARRGDVVALDTEQGPALGVCLGALIAAPIAAGLVFLPFTAAQAAWRI